MKRTKKPLKRTLLCFISVELFAFIILPALILTLTYLFSSLPPFSHGNDLQDGQIPSGKLKTPKTIAVYRHSYGIVENIPFEEYIKGVVAGEMPASFEPEALKAQAVAARTYSLSKYLRGCPDAHPQAPLCDDTHCQVYRSTYELAALKGDAWMADGWLKICSAVDETEGELMYYKGSLAEQPLFHSSSGGRTENSEDVFASAVPYLRSVKSPYEEDATHRDEEKAFSASDFINLLNQKYPSRGLSAPLKTIDIVSRSDGGRVGEIKINGISYDGRELREALNLSSANFEVIFDRKTPNGDIKIISTGYGHGVGMSQYGANGMAKKGYGYKKILRHYYTGISVY